MEKKKNLWVIPTNKPSRLLKFANELMFDKDTELRDKRGVHVYITSDEEIKEGDWCFELYNGQSQATSPKFIDEKGNVWWLRVMNMNCSANDPECKKIILTTDQDLIKSGVQAIDDEFLEWFVKNPTCEFVETFYSDKDLDGYWKGIEQYQIIIPKEEPKQETLEEARRLYNERDVSEYAYYFESCYAKRPMETPLPPKQWFEQFKKK
jgi:hypothetical protein